MIVLGIDPGSRKAGYAVIEQKSREIIYRTSGVMRYDSEKEFIRRLGSIHDSCQKLLHEYRPDAVAFESLVYVKNVTSLAKLAQARGAMLAAFGSDYREKLFEYSPNLVKSTVSGHGHADKAGMEKVLKMLFGNIEFQTDDESDALSIAVCHALHLGGASELKGSKKSKGSGMKSALAHRVEGG